MASKRVPEAHLLKVISGKNKGQFKYKLFGTNGEPIGGSWNETYYNKKGAEKTLIKYHSNFTIIDKTGSVEKKPKAAKITTGKSDIF